MNLQKLKYFYYAAKLHSVTDSARANFVTQSAVSQAIRGLEIELDTKLINHAKNSFELTDNGHIVFRECQIIFDAIENLKANLNRKGGELRGVLKIASTNSIADALLVPTLKTISKRHPLLTVQLKLGNSDQVKEYLRNQEADLGFIIEDDEMDDLTSTFILDGFFRLIATPKLAANKDLKKVIITRQSKIEIKQLKKKLGSNVQFQMEVFSWQLIRLLCLQGAGIGYLPDYLVKKDIEKNLLQICKPEVKTWKYRLLAIQKNKRILSGSSQMFLDAVVARNTSE